MARDGTFLAQDGRAAVEESFEMVVPPLKVRNFHFSEVTKLSFFGHPNTVSIPYERFDSYSV
jgi:hypothetical protein